MCLNEHKNNFPFYTVQALCSASILYIYKDNCSRSFWENETIARDTQ